MKKILITLLAISAITFSAVAQDEKAPKENHPHYMMKELNLTQDQLAQIKMYNKDYRGQLQELNKNETITVKEYRSRLEAVNKDHKAKIKSILTADQKAKLLQLKVQHAEQRDSIAAKRLDKMKQNLNLTDEQVAQIKAQRDAVHEKIEAIKENDSLTNEQKKDQLMSVRDESKENFKKILTTDQLNKLKQLRKAKLDKASS